MSQESAKLFVAYTRTDKELEEALLVHLSSLKRQDIVEIWDDGLIAVGDNWDDKIKEHLETANIILLLVSADFIASEYCFEVEIKRAVERHDAGEAQVIPVLLRPCDWKGAPFSKIQLLPRDARPVTTWGNQDEALTNVAKEIRAVAEGVREEKLRRAEEEAKRKAEAEAERKKERKRKLLFRRIITPVDGEVGIYQEIPAGEFLMGSPESEAGRDENEGPQCKILIQSPFLIAAVPVTVGQFKAFDPEHYVYWEGRVPEEELSSHPMVGVSLADAFAFCDWLAKTWPWARGARLPTEEEWEYACRAGSKTRYWSGDTVSDLRRAAWYKDNSDLRTHRVGEKAANAWGLYDMLGNVWERTMTKWTNDYSGRRGPNADNPSVATSGEDLGRDDRYVIRGGGFRDVAQGVRAAKRAEDYILGGGGYLGFRVLIPTVEASKR